MLTAIETIQRVQGGMVIINNGEVLAEISLNIAGLILEQCSELVYKQITKINIGLQSISSNTTFNPFLTLSFLFLPVIPNIKMTYLMLRISHIFQFHFFKISSIARDFFISRQTHIQSDSCPTYFINVNQFQEM